MEDNTITPTKTDTISPTKTDTISPTKTDTISTSTTVSSSGSIHDPPGFIHPSSQDLFLTDARIKSCYRARCSQFGIMDGTEKGELATWYNGYYQGSSDQQVKTYCPWSVRNYLNSRVQKWYDSVSKSSFFEPVHQTKYRKTWLLMKRLHLNVPISFRTITSRLYRDRMYNARYQNEYVQFFSYLLATGDIA